MTMVVQDLLEAMAEAALVKVQAVAALMVDDALVVVEATFVEVVLAVVLVVAVAGRAVMLEAKAAARAA